MYALQTLTRYWKAGEDELENTEDALIKVEFPATSGNVSSSVLSEPRVPEAGGWASVTQRGVGNYVKGINDKGGRIVAWDCVAHRPLLRRKSALGERVASKWRAGRQS